MWYPRGTEDAKNVGLIAGSAAVALAVTAALLAKPSSARYTVEYTPTQTVTLVEGDALADRLYGTVVTRSGEELTGYLRWDRNEGSWSDLLDANKPSAQSGIRFGHVRVIERTGANSARFTLKSGEQVDFTGNATDLGSALRALVVEDPTRGTGELEWRDLQSVHFSAAPDGMRPSDERLAGVLRTRSGAEFRGYITWDVDEIYSSDVLDGEDQDGADREIRFGDIASIARHSSASARVTLRDGRELILRGTNDVDDSNRGISVSDASLGQVKVDWDEFGEVRFENVASIGYGFFDGGSPLRGTVRAESGATFEGVIVWDDDEAYSWEMLNGEADGAEFHVELRHVAAIEKNAIGSGAVVELRDGRRLELRGSNDVAGGNRGIFVRTGDDTVRIPWSAFREVRFDD